MAVVTRGYTFGATEQVTNTKLHTLVDNATISNVQAIDFASGFNGVTTGTSAPTNTDGLWIDTNTTPPTLKVYNSSSSTWVPSQELNILTNKSGISLSAGAVTIISTGTSESITTTSTQGNVSWRGIALQTVANNSTGVFKAQGYVPNITLETSASAGCFLCTSTATGKAVQVASGTAGIFGVVTTAGTASAGAYLFGATNQGGFIPTATNALSGSIVQVAWTPVTGVATGTTTIPKDDTNPTSSEGDLYITAGSFTAKSASNSVLVLMMGYFEHSGNLQGIIGATFQDAGSNSLKSAPYNLVNGGGVGTFCILPYFGVVGTVSPTTFTSRWGGTTGTVTFNGTGGTNRLLGGFMASGCLIVEFKA